jgi:hypothetical protein
MKSFWIALLSAAAVLAADTFTNPLLHTGPDPWVVQWKGFYYYSNSTGKNLTLRKTADITTGIPGREEFREFREFRDNSGTVTTTPN